MVTSFDDIIDEVLAASGLNVHSYYALGEPFRITVSGINLDGYLPVPAPVDLVRIEDLEVAPSIPFQHFRLDYMSMGLEISDTLLQQNKVAHQRLECDIVEEASNNQCLIDLDWE